MAANKQIEMTGEYPVATLRFRDNDLPVQIELTAFSPMEPLDVDFSSMPLAIFRFRLTNPTAEPQLVSLAAMMTNPVGYEAKGDIDGIRHPNFGGNVNEVFRHGQMAGLFMHDAGGQSVKSPGFGTLALATTGPDVTALGQFEDWSVAWEEFSKNGRFSPLEGVPATSPTQQGRTINGAIASTISIPAGGSVDVPFFTWRYSNNYYKETGEWIGCHYATRWTDARAVVADAAASRERLVERTERYRRTFYDGTLPDWLLDCVTANSGIMRHIGVLSESQTEMFMDRKVEMGVAIQPARTYGDMNSPGASFSIAGKGHAADRFHASARPRWRHQQSHCGAHLRRIQLASIRFPTGMPVAF